MDNSHINNITKTASADMPKGTVVKLDASDASKVVACAAADSDALGVVLDDVKSGESVAVALLGVANHTVEVVASGAITAGAKVYLDASGKVRAAPAAGDSDQSVVCVGIALTPAYADGNIVELAHRAPVGETIAKTA